MSPMATLHYCSFYICAALLCVSCLGYTLIQGRVARRQNQLYILLLLNTRAFDTSKSAKPHSGYIFLANYKYVYCIIA